jgi:hypothetical protein
MPSIKPASDPREGPRLCRERAMRVKPADVLLFDFG